MYLVTMRVQCTRHDRPPIADRAVGRLDSSEKIRNSVRDARNVGPTDGDGDTRAISRGKISRAISFRPVSVKGTLLRRYRGERVAVRLRHFRRRDEP